MNTIAQHLHKHIKESITLKYEGRPKRNYQDKIHASDVYDFCARRLVLSRNTGKGIVKAPVASYGTYITFEIGNYVQQLVIESLVNNIIAHWECLSCKRDWYGLRPPKCACGSLWFHYNELGFSIPLGAVDIVGHIDIFYKLPSGKIIPVEVKSIDGDRFDKLVEPLTSNEIQVQTYLWGLCHKKAAIPSWLVDRYRIDSTVGAIIYVSKAHRYDPLKVFPVQLSKVHSASMSVIEREMKAYSKNGKIPNRICNTRLFPMARKCSLVDECFADNGK